MNREDTDTWDDRIDEMKIKFDQYVIFPMHVKYERIKRLVRRYIQTHPLFVEWIDIVSVMLCCMVISYLMHMVSVRYGTRM